MAVSVGDKAPDFTLPSQTGTSLKLSDFRGKKAVVLYFYPKDDTPGCTAEACAFRDSYSIFQEAGAEVLGVSGDTPAEHQRFVKKYNLPFILLSDEGDRVRNMYGVPATFWVLPGRVTYVIDREGVIQHIFDSAFDFQAHAKEAIASIQKLSPL